MGLGSDPTSRSHSWGLTPSASSAVAYVTLFALAAAFRFLALKNGFVNDHFVYITGGRQILYGEWPTRDWIDPGLPLMFGASALAQTTFGPTLFAEAILVAVAFGLGAAFTAAAVRNLTGSLSLAVLAAVIEVAAFPRTYSYPKITMYAVVFWLYGHYLRAPGMKRMMAMAAGIAIAFMFRHDHGLFLWAGGALTVFLGSDRSRWTDRLREVAALTGVLLLFILPYLLYVEAFAGLGVYLRTGYEFSRREASRQWHVWPRVFGDEHPLESAMVYELHVLPLIAGLVLVTRTATAHVRATVSGVLPVAVVAVLVNVAFIRDPLNTRLADAIVPAVILGAWLLWVAFRAASWRMLTVPLALGVAALMSASVLAVGHTHEEIDRAGLLGRRQQIPGRFVERAADLRSRFVDYQMPNETSRRLVPFFRYVDRCTLTSDRLLVGGFLVEVPFYAQRAFAAGQEYFGAYFTSKANEEWAFDHMRRQRVPFVILPSDQEGEFDDFALVAPYVRQRYVVLTDVAINDDRTVHILVDRTLRAEGQDPETGWPCFTTSVVAR